MKTRERLLVQPLGKIDKETITSLKSILEERFGFEILLADEMSIPLYTLNPRRRQFHAPTILRRLKKIDENANKILGVATVDLYVPGLNYVFGQAEIDGRVALISLYRLRPEFDAKTSNPTEGKALFLERAGKEAVHEIGHTLGMRHCPTSTCVMHFSNSIADTDKKDDTFCPDHQKLLRK
jgi:archaemetzincin